MRSVSSPVDAALEGYVAGRLKAEQLVVAVAIAYYGGEEGRAGGGERLKPLIDVIDRASPGIVELGSVPSGPGFDVRLGERPFPKQYEPQLRRAAEAVLTGATRVGAQPAAPLPSAGVFARLVGAIRSLFARG
jgi:hypothetical protein